MPGMWERCIQVWIDKPRQDRGLHLKVRLQVATVRRARD